MNLALNLPPLIGLGLGLAAWAYVVLQHRALQKRARSAAAVRGDDAS